MTLRVNVLPENVGQSSPKWLKTCYPLRLPIMPNFIEIGQNQLGEKHYKSWASDKKFFCHGQKRDYLSAIGATKKAKTLTALHSMYIGKK